MNELNQLKNEINRKYAEQRRAYEQKLLALRMKLDRVERELATKDEKIERLMEENEKFHFIHPVEKSKEVKMKIDAETNTDSWDALLETELKERLEAFIELYNEAPNTMSDHFQSLLSNEQVSFGVDRRTNDEQNRTTKDVKAILDSTKIKNDSPPQPLRKLRGRTKKKSPEENLSSFNDTSLSFIKKSSNRQIDQMERILTDRYDKLTVDASILFKNVDQKHLFLT